MGLFYDILFSWFDPTHYSVTSLDRDLRLSLLTWPVIILQYRYSFFSLARAKQLNICLYHQLTALTLVNSLVTTITRVNRPHRYSWTSNHRRYNPEFTNGWSRSKFAGNNDYFFFTFNVARKFIFNTTFWLLRFYTLGRE